MKFRFTRAVGRRAACIGLSVAMCASLAAGQLAAFARGGKGGLVASADTEVYSAAFENANGKIDLTDIKVQNFSKDVIENTGVTSDVYSLTRTVIVTLQGAPLSERSYDGESAREEIAAEQKRFLSELNKANVDYELKSSYYSIANAVAINVRLSELSTIKHIKGVNTVSVGSTYARPQAIKETDGAQKNASNIYATGIYDSSAQVETGNDGRGVSVAILDTGLDYTHEAFKSAPKAVRYTENDVADLMESTTFAAARRSGATVDDVYISSKVPFAYDYADSDSNVYPSYSQHGTHVAGIVAGKSASYTDKDGNVPMEEVKNEAGEIERVPVEFRGVAPEAQLVICKVFTDNLDDDQIGGAEAVDILDALEDCWNLNVDVINMSLGTSAGFSSRALCPTDMKEDDEEGYLMKRIYERIRNKGISLIVAASNDFSAGYGSAFGTNLISNPDSGTVGSPSTFTGALSVASVNGQYSPYFTAQPTGTTTNTAIYFEESRNEDSEAYDFVNEMLDLVNEGKNEDEKVTSATFRYVVVPGTGEPTDFALVERALRNKEPGEKVVAVVRRGNSPFKDKISNAMSYGADAVIVYNNVSGLIRMSLGDMRTHIPAVSVTLDAGLVLTGDGRKSGGTITIDKTYSAGPFMNDYSSWGSTPDLKLKPDVTSHGGEITSTVAGGYEQMSGTSMACPNLAGFEAIFKGYLKNKEELWKDNGATDEENALALTKLTNNIVMSTATTVYDQNKLPYSPRKQGAGLATLANVFGTNAYLYTDEADGMCEDGRPKAELGDDKNKSGVYNIKFHVKNFGDSTLTFKTNSIFMTETVGKDKMSVAEMAHVFGDRAVWTVGGNKVGEGETFTVAPGEDKKIEVTLTLTREDKEYLKVFTNGMFVEGFLQLLSTDGVQCDLNLPFMGFYGNWKDAPMMDRTAFEIAESAKDTSIKDEDRLQPQVWATQAYGYYAGERYTIPLGSFLYIQDEAKEHTPEYVYVEEEHIAVSRDFHRINSEDENDPANYLTTTGIKALYAGLLRNAEVVTYTLTNVDTGEIVPDENGNETRVVFRANKSFAGGGNAMPSQVLTELKTEELGLAANGKYNLTFNFYFDYDDYKAYIDGDEHAFEDENGNTLGVYANNTFSMNFYIDYEAPVLVDSRIRFQNMKDASNRDYQKVYLDLDIFDNHYPQAIILCYSERDDGENTDLQTIKLATDYIIPVLNPVKNSINTVSIDISDFYDQYGGRLFVEIDDYALNHNTYFIIPDYSKTTSTCPGDFKLTYNGTEVAAADAGSGALGSLQNPIVIEKNTAVKFGLEDIGSADASNFAWSVNRSDVIKVKNGEVFAVGEGNAVLTVRGGRNANGTPVSKSVRIKVKDTGKQVTVVPRATFGTIINASDALEKAENSVDVESCQKITLTPVVEPWYYPVENLVWEWSSGDTNRAVVDRSGNVTIVYEGEYSERVEITAAARLKGEEDGDPLFRTQVTFNIQPAFRANGTTLAEYSGLGGELKESVTLGNQTFENVHVLTFPERMSVTAIGDEAFKDNEYVEIVVIPKSVTSIGENAFENCKNLKAICFIDTEKQKVADASLTLIHRYAFMDCPNLTVVDLSNCKVFTLDRNVFSGCTGLKEVVDMTKIGTMHSNTFSGCTSLESVDITKLHIADSGIFAGCTSLTEIKTSDETVIGSGMFSGCTALESVEIKCAAIGDSAFRGCTKLKTVTLSYGGDSVKTIGARAFENCTALTDLVITGKTVSSIGDYGFANCAALKSPYTSADFNPELGNGVFRNVASMSGNAVTNGTKLVRAPEVIDAAFVATLSGIDEIAPYAFAESRMASGITSLNLSGVTKIGVGAFAGVTGLQSVTLNTALTSIPAYAFYGCADLTGISLPAGVTSVGNYAFYGCGLLATTNIDSLASLKNIGAGAFGGTAVTSLNLPDGVESIGDEAFARCTALETVTINSVKNMGSRVFALCPALESVTFGANAESTGEYTFSNVGYSYDYANGGLVISETIESSLTSVEFGDKIVRIGDGVFAYDYEIIGNQRVVYACDKLRVINLNKVTELGESAFAGCVNLATVTGMEKVKTFGAYAFEACSSLTVADLSAAEEIYPCAFQTATNLATVTLGDKVEGIGDYAFYLTAISGTVTIPATCEYVGVAAFGRTGITAFDVAEGNGYYTDIDGVLYRYINKAERTYELTAYPANRTADTVGGLRTFTVAEGTVSILAYAFNNVQ